MRAAQRRLRGGCVGRAGGHLYGPRWGRAIQNERMSRADSPVAPLSGSLQDSLYLQIAERMAQSIRSGTLARGERLPSVRGLAASALVNPNTVAKAVASAVRLDVQMLTIHTSGGSAMMRAAEEAAQQTALQSGRNAPLVLGVTVLTSHDANTLAEIGFEANVGRQVERLARLAVQSGLRGLVCSPLEIADLRQILPEKIQLVTPGIRTGAEKADDQKRTLTPREAMDAGASWLVIGRPIYAAENPRAAAEKIQASLRQP